MLATCIPSSFDPVLKMSSPQNWTLIQDKDGRIQLLKNGEAVEYGYICSIKHIYKDKQSILCVS